MSEVRSADSAGTPEEGDERGARGPEAGGESADEALWRSIRERRWHQRKLVRVTLVLAAVVGAAAIIPYPLFVRAECSIVAARRAHVRADIAGTIDDIVVDEGDRVDRGQLLARLDDRLLSARRDRAAAELRRIEAELSALGDDSGRDAMEAERDRAVAELEGIELQLEQMIEIRSPISGVVLTPRFRERLGERVEAGELIATIVDPSLVRAELLVPEKEIDAVDLGMPVKVKVGSYPLRSFEGKVDFIAPLMVERDGVNRVRVVAEIDNADGALKESMRGYGEVYSGRRSLLDIVTRRLIRWVRVRYLL